MASDEVWERQAKVKTLAGVVCARNCVELDYCLREAVDSMLAVCDEVVISDCESTDGTWERIQAWACREPKITMCRFPWTDPTNTDQWYPEWINYARQHAKSQMCVYLDADEVLHEKDEQRIRQAADAGQTLFFRRFNFWKDAQSLIPEGVCCGTKVLRMAPSNMPTASDYPYAPADATMKQAVESKIKVYHYGFLRKRDAFFRKARVVQKIWTGGFDPRLEAAEKFEGNWATMPNVTGWEDKLVPFKGEHPRVIHEWLTERGFSATK